MFRSSRRPTVTGMSYFSVKEVDFRLEAVRS